MKKFVVYIHLVDGKEATQHQVEANSESEVFAKIYQDDLFYDFKHKHKSFRVNLSHITRVVVVEGKL